MFCFTYMWELHALTLHFFIDLLLIIFTLNFQVDVLVSGFPINFVPYTKIPFDASLCNILSTVPAMVSSTIPTASTITEKTSSSSSAHSFPTKTTTKTPFGKAFQLLETITKLQVYSNKHN